MKGESISSFDRELAAKVGEEFANAKRDRQRFWIRWNRYYKMANSTPDSPVGYGEGEFYLPYPHQAVMNLVSKVSSEDPRLLVVPEEEDANKQTDVAQKLIDWQLRRLRYDRVTESFLWSMAVYGTAIVKVTWNVDDPKANLPIIGIVQPEFFYPAPDASASYLPWCHQLFTRTWEELSRNPAYDQQALKLLKAKGGSGDDPENVTSIKRASLSLGKIMETTERMKFKVIERWGLERRKYLTDGGSGDPDELIPAKVVIAEDTFVLQAIKNPFVTDVADYSNPFYNGPFAIGRLYNKDNEFWGDTFMRHIDPLVTEAITNRRQIIDNNSLMNNRMYLAGMNSGLNARNLKSKQGGVILVNDINQFRELPIQPLSSAAYSLGDVIKGDIQQTTGANDYQIGMTSNKPNLNNTATGVLAVNEQVNFLFKKVAKHVEWVHRDVGEMILVLDQMFLPKTTIPVPAEPMQRALGPGHLYDFVELDRKAIDGLMNVHVEVGSTQSADPQTDMARVEAAMNILNQPVVASNVNVQWSALIMRALKDLGFKDVEQYVTPATPPIDHATLQQNLAQKSPQELAALAQKLDLRPSDIQQGAGGNPNVNVVQTPHSLLSANQRFSQTAQSALPQPR